MTEKTMRRIAIFFSLIFLLFSSTSAFAAEFSTAYDVTYQVNESGITTVVNQISLINLKSDLYAKEYSLIISSEKIDNIKANDSLGPLQLKVNKKDGSTEIKVSFNEKIVGSGKVLTFTLSYDTAELSTKQGRIWEINIPAPIKEKTVSNYKITLSVPKSFGSPAYLKPQPAYGLTWTSEKTSSPITVGFGQYQSLDFQLKYHLKNSSLTPRLYQFPLPAETLYQKIVLENLSPLPENIILDEDNNWLAQYHLHPQQTLDVLATGSAFLFLEKRDDYPLTDFSLEKYLKAEKFWEKDDPEIIKLAQELKTPAKIYQYVVNTLTYDLQRVAEKSERLGAKTILKSPSKATCMEFTDLFIALCRAAGIPAREINGLGFSNNPQLKPLSLAEDFLHAWSEYYDFDKKNWIPVDPTWEKTTGGVDYFHHLDFNHFTLVTHGLSSETPVPEKSIKIDFSQKELPQSKENFKLLVNFPKKIVAGRTIRGEVEVQNLGREAILGRNLKILSSNFSPNSQNFNLFFLPPYGHQVFSLAYPSKNLLFWGENEFRAQLGASEENWQVKIEPWPVVYLPHLLAISFALSILCLSILLFKRNLTAANDEV